MNRSEKQWVEMVAEFAKVHVNAGKPAEEAVALGIRDYNAYLAALAKNPAKRQAMVAYVAKGVWTQVRAARS